MKSLRFVVIKEQMDALCPSARRVRGAGRDTQLQRGPSSGLLLRHGSLLALQAYVLRLLRNVLHANMGAGVLSSEEGKSSKISSWP